MPVADVEAVSRIDDLFAIERDINSSSVRRERSRPQVEALGTWLREQYARLSPNCQVAKAIAYSLNCWRPLPRFLDDGRLYLSDNAVERAVRGAAVVRHNWTFAGSDQGGQCATAIYTLINSAKLNKVAPVDLARAWARTAD